MSDKASSLKQAAPAIATQAKDAAVKVADETGLNSRAAKFANTFKSELADPAARQAKM